MIVAPSLFERRAAAGSFSSDNLFFDVNADDQAGADLSTPSTVTDSSGNSYEFTTEGGRDNPVLHHDYVNGHKALESSGNTTMSAAAALSRANTDPLTFYCGYAPKTDPTTATFTAIWCAQTSGSSTNPDWLLADKWGANITGLRRNSGGGVILDIGAPAIGTWTVISGIFNPSLPGGDPDNAHLKIFHDGVRDDTINTLSEFRLTDVMSLFGRGGTGSLSSSIYLWRLAFFDVAHDEDTEHADNVTFLKTALGI